MKTPQPRFPEHGPATAGAQPAAGTDDAEPKGTAPAGSAEARSKAAKSRMQRHFVAAARSSGRSRSRNPRIAAS